MRSFRPFWLLLTLLCVTLLSCNFSLPGAAPVVPCSVVTSQVAADRFIKRLQDANKNKGKTVTITATSEEVNSLLDTFIRQTKQDNPTAPIPLESPSICFNQNGIMTVTGKLMLDPTNPIDAQLVARANLSNGKVAFKIEQLQLGPISVPTEFSSQIETFLNNTLNQFVDQVALTEIKITSGQISLTGKVP